MNSSVLLLQFKFASRFDIFLIVLGTFFSILHGLAWPLVCLNLGELIDTFISHFQGKNVSITSSALDYFISQSSSINGSVPFCDEVFNFSGSCVDFEEQLTRRAVDFSIIGGVTFVCAFFQVGYHIANGKPTMQTDTQTAKQTIRHVDKQTDIQTYK
jgi:hypothetical protein